MTWAALMIVLTTPLVYCFTRYVLHSDWGAFLALIGTVAWVRFLLAVLI